MQDSMLLGHRNENSTLEQTSTAGVDAKKVRTDTLLPIQILDHWISGVKSCRNNS